MVTVLATSNRNNELKRQRSNDRDTTAVFERRGSEIFSEIVLSRNGYDF